MTRYVALLRGINLGPARRVAMPQLRTMAAGLGYTDVATHLNSGNLLLSSDEGAATVGHRVERAIEETFGLHSDVVVRTPEQLAAVVAANPFADGDPTQVTVAFLAGPPPAGAAERIGALATADEPYLVTGQEVYVRYGHGQAGSRLAARFAATLGVTATVRNLRTTTKLLDLASR